MAYTAPQIATILLKADKTMYKIGQIAYENMFAEDNEALDYERDVIFIYKKAVEYADDFFVGTEKLDKVVERLATKISAYDYGVLNPIYADAATINTPVLLPGSALNDLTDVTISNLLDNQLLRYNTATGQWINVGPGAAVRNSQAFTATAGQTVFTTSYPFDAGLFDLYVNGVKLNSLSYTTMGEYQITLNDPCIAGDIVDVVIYDSYTGINPSIGSLNDLTDVSIGALTNNQALYYNSATGLWQNGLVFVPYTGATASVDLGEFEIRAGQFTLDTSPTGTATVGTTRWNDSIGSSETTLKGGSVILKNGVDLVARVINKVTPNTTLTKASYAAVRISGAQGQRLAVAYAQANNDANSADTIGLVTETIATNQEGFIMTMGSLEGINTTGSLQGETWADGDVLYLSPTVPGRITNVKPTGATGHIVVVGYVEYAHANNGKIYVKTMNGWELDELHNVNINTGTLANGDVLKYNATTQLWENGVDAGGITGTGVAGQVPYFTGASAVSGSADLIYNNTNKSFQLSNSTNSGSTRGLYLTQTTADGAGNLFVFQKSRGGVITSGTTIGVIDAEGFDGTAYQKSARISFTASGTISSGIVPGTISFVTTNSSGVLTGRTTINESGLLSNNGNFQNLGNAFLGFATDQGVRLAVSGDTLLRGSGNTSVTTALTVQNSDSSALLKVDNSGSIYIGNAGSRTPYIAPYSDATTQSLTGRAIGFVSTVGPNAAVPAFIFTATSLTATSGTGRFVEISPTYSPTSGTGTLALLAIQATINQTGGANGITRGLYVNPTLTAAADFRAIETTAGNVLFGASGTGFFWDNANSRLGIGTNAPSTTLDIRGKARIETTGTTELDMFAGGGNILRISCSSTTPFIGTLTNAPLGFFTSATERGRFTTNGNLMLGTTSDLGVRLGVVGDTILRGSGATSATTALTVQNSDSANMLRLLNDNTLKIGSQNIDIFPTADGSAVSNAGRGLIISTSAGTQTTGAVKIVGSSTLASGNDWSLWLSHSFAPASGTATHSGLLLNQTINQQGGANGVTRGLYVNPTLTAAADWRSIEWSNNSGWGLYGAGTANNYLAGSLGIGTTTLTTANLRVALNLGIATNTSLQYGIVSDGTVQSTVTVLASNYLSTTKTQATAFTIPYVIGYYATQGTFGASSVVTAQMGFWADNTLTGATNNYGFYGNIASGTGRWNLYMNGTAENYLAGNLGIGVLGLAETTFFLNKNITGGATAWAMRSQGTIQSDVTSGRYFVTLASTQAATFTLNTLFHYLASATTFGAGSTVTEQYGFHAASQLTGATNNYGFFGNIASGTGRWNIYMAGTADNYLAGRLAIGTTSAIANNIFQVALPMTSATVVSGVNSYGQIQSDVTSEARYFNSAASTQSATFTLNNLIHFNANQSTFGANSIVTTQIGFHVNSSLTGATNNYGFFGNIAAATGRWNLYMNGTADNYLAGNLGIGITPTVRLHVSGDTILRGSGATSATTALTVQNSSSTNLFTVRNDGLVGVVNTTDYTGRTLFLQGGFASTVNIIASNNSYSGTSGAFNVFHFQGSFVPTSGSAVFRGLNIAPTINQTGGASGVSVGIRVAPTLTAAADFRAIETTDGKIIFGNLPTSSAGLPTGALWNNGGVINIV